ncbi:MAG: Na/Pi cotransporter family protein [Bacteroidetes bacterium]|uniref:Na/Pi cotransporter family protein n=1 Tax=Candidatus Cryptobacteroides intestinigallinarum TaxID=2840767 RepID=A0A9D9HJ54_9BACT|nr:Na/Pi cotransporter family protein [Candidatus Cryptobacteroides intestinigallinarum]
MVLQILTLIGALGMFLYGMNTMSSGLQKASGEKLRSFLAAMTSNPFKGVLTGLGITAIIQSSSATTVMVVGFVNAGLLTLNQAVGVIMGANIGTTVTAWLISLLGFKMDISVISIPLMAVGFICSMSKKSKTKNIGEFIIGFSLLFLGLSFMKSSVPDLESHPEVLSFIARWTDLGFWSVLIFLAFGTLLTLILQSSSATVALTLIMLNMGWIPFEMAAAMVMGENIGTTITANIAAAVGNVQSKRAALAHTMFNVFGVIWALIFFRPFLSFIGKLIVLIGYPDPTTVTTFAGEIGGEQTAESTAALYGIAMLHMMFNLINTCILIWFIPFIVKAVMFIIKSPAKPEEETFKLKYINAGHLATAEISIEQAMKEIVHFAEISRKGLGYVKLAINEQVPDKFEEYRQKLVKYEEISDRIEYEIATFMNSLSKEDISEDSKAQIRAMYKIISELESLGDSGEAISRILSRKNAHGKVFDSEELRTLGIMTDLVDKAYVAMINNLNIGYDNLKDISNAYDAEQNINEMRNNLREEEIVNIEHDGKNYQTSVYYMDVLSELESMGDFMINVSQALAKNKN